VIGNLVGQKLVPAQEYGVDAVAHVSPVFVVAQVDFGLGPSMRN
jgi:hypothetical protein